MVHFGNACVIQFHMFIGLKKLCSFGLWRCLEYSSVAKNGYLRLEVAQMAGFCFVVIILVYIML